MAVRNIEQVMDLVFRFGLHCEQSELVLCIKMLVFCASELGGYSIEGHLDVTCICLKSAIILANMGAAMNFKFGSTLGFFSVRATNYREAFVTTSCLQCVHPYARSVLDATRWI
jgi:hypothetical protein